MTTSTGQPLPTVSFHWEEGQDIFLHGERGSRPTTQPVTWKKNGTYLFPGTALAPAGTEETRGALVLSLTPSPHPGTHYRNPTKPVSATLRGLPSSECLLGQARKRGQLKAQIRAVLHKVRPWCLPSAVYTALQGLPCTSSPGSQNSFCSLSMPAA